MADTRCRVCGAPTDAYLCRNPDPDHPGCADELEKVLAEMPARMRDLTVTAGRLAKIGDTPLQAQKRPDDYTLEQARIPAMLKSTQGRITLISTAMPVNIDAAKLHAEAVNGITTWARHLVESRGTAGPTGRVTERQRGRVVRNRYELYWQPYRWPLTIQDICTWLVASIESIRLDEAAAEMHTAATSLAGWIDQTVDRRDPEVFGGICTATDVRVEPLRPIGPPCTTYLVHEGRPACEHRDCQLIRGDIRVDTYITGICGTDLRPEPGEPEVQCERCGTVWKVDERLTWMADEMADKLGTVREVSGFLRSLTLDIDGETVPLEVTVDKVNGWLARRRIVDYGTAPNGNRLVKVGEVREYAEQWARRRAARRRGEKMAS